MGKWAFLGGIALVTLAVGCGGEANPKPAQPPKVDNLSAVSRYLPLEPGTVLAYETKDLVTGETGASWLRVEAPREDLRELNDGGHLQRLHIRPEGIAFEEGGFLLRGPLVKGARFPGRVGEVTIVALAQTVEVPAGRFTDCVLTEESTELSTIRQSFCALVGVTTIEVEGEQAGVVVHQTARLRSFGRAVNVKEMSGASSFDDPTQVDVSQD